MLVEELEVNYFQKDVQLGNLKGLLEFLKSFDMEELIQILIFFSFLNCITLITTQKMNNITTNNFQHLHGSFFKHYRRFFRKKMKLSEDPFITSSTLTTQTFSGEKSHITLKNTTHELAYKSRSCVY